MQRCPFHYDMDTSANQPTIRTMVKASAEFRSQEGLPTWSNTEEHHVAPCPCFSNEVTGIVVQAASLIEGIDQYHCD